MAGRSTGRARFSAARTSNQHGNGSGVVMAPSFARVLNFFSSGRGSRGMGATKNRHARN